MTRSAFLRRCATAGATLFALVTALVGVNEGAPATFLVADTTLGLLFIVAGAIAWERRPEVRSGPLLTLAGVLWFVGSYAPTSLERASLLGFAFERYYDVVLAFLALTFPQAALSRGGTLVLGGLAATFVARTLGRLLVGCECMPNPWALVDDRALFDTIQLVTTATILGLALVIAVLAARRLLGPPTAARRIMRPVVAAGVVAAVSAAYDALELLAIVGTGRQLVNLPEPLQELAGWLPFVAVALVPAGFLVGSLRLRAAHGPIVPLAVEIDRGADASQVERALRHALGEPSLELLRWDEQGAKWLDSSGAPVAAPVETSARAITPLARDGRPIAALVHDPWLREDPGLVAAVAAVLRMAVENERLAADVRRRLEEVRASRVRVIEAAESERRRIERDLHDGAQQRLVSVGIKLNEALTAARREAPHAGFVHRLDETADELRAAIDELRELARGIHPAVLTEEGLGTAVASLARRSSLPVELEIALDRRLPPAVEATGYYVVAEALTNVTRHARARSASVRLALANGHLEVEVTDDGEGGTDPARGSGLRGLADRLDAIAGELEISSPPRGGTRLRAVIPCA